MLSEINKLIASNDEKLHSSANQISQLTQMLDEASVAHQRLLGERAAYEKLKTIYEATNNEEGVTDDKTS